MDSGYRKTRYGWEPAQDWGVSEIRPDPQARAEGVIDRLVAETVACGVPLDRAVKWWDRVLRKWMLLAP